MENIEISKEKLLKIRDVIIFVLLFFWMTMPMFQMIRGIYDIIDLDDWYFLLMKIIGVVGIGISVFDIYDRIRNSENKKQVLKEILPIFIFVLYMAWTLISCHSTYNKVNAFYGSYYRREGYYMYLNYAGYFLCAFLLKNEKLRKILLNTFMITTIFMIVVSRMSLSVKNITAIFVNTSVEKTVFAQFNHYAYYLLMAFMCGLGLFITEKNKIIKIAYLVAYTMIGYALIYNNTFGCYLAAAVLLALYGIYAVIKKTDRKLILVAIIIFVLLSCITEKKDKNIAFRNISEFMTDIKTIMSKFVDTDAEVTKNEVEKEVTSEVTVENKKQEEVEQDFENVGTNRMKLWVNGIKFVLKKPIIGYGPDNLRVEYNSVGISQDRPHNLFIYLAAVSGIPGMLIYVTAVGIIIIKGIKKLFGNNKQGTIYLIIVIAYLISSMFGNSMFYTSPYFFIFLGSLMHCNLNKQEE